MKKNKELPKVQPVHLKPIFGLKPGVWLTILYSIILVLAVFLICFLPGIKKGYKRVTFTSATYNAAVYIDGNYSGGTPYTVSVKSGKHNIEYKVNGVLIDDFDIKVSHPVFLTWLFPRKMTVSSTATLNEEAYRALTKEFFEDLSTYSAILEYNDVHRYPKLFETYAKSISTYSAADTSLLKKYATCFITTDEMLSDAQIAFDLLGLGKVEIPSDGTFTQTSSEISNTPVTEAQYLQFTKENPYWSASNKEELVSKGLVDNCYLEGTSSSSIKSIVNVSYYAASAYCEWLSKKEGKNYSLPTQQQWTQECKKYKQTFSKSILLDSKTSQPSYMLGGVWEITSSCYVPNGDSEEVQNFLNSLGVQTDIVVKGGSYINSANDITSETVGTSTRNLCSDYMGFRVICND